MAGIKWHSMFAKLKRRKNRFSVKLLYTIFCESTVFIFHGLKDYLTLPNVRLSLGANVHTLTVQTFNSCNSQPDICQCLDS